MALHKVSVSAERLQCDACSGTFIRLPETRVIKPTWSSSSVSTVSHHSLILPAFLSLLIAFLFLYILQKACSHLICQVANTGKRLFGSLGPFHVLPILCFFPFFCEAQNHIRTRWNVNWKTLGLIHKACVRMILCLKSAYKKKSWFFDNLRSKMFLNLQKNDILKSHILLVTL